ncbi:unnamed protein product [Tilletia caries]|nr:hypothetical protein CF328_g6258 [Tilletia controversa]KAE8190968.1 hypothetical protein CF335_g6213 [Tilletia laevis]KAE8252466.1 hypothetical protein A4X03_0g6157 [Tilletia caries]CAD6898446.1 unnamed protein product [Tilletia caries]CAD6921248.1 unnamed protein product [Tilletia caries]
MRIAAKLGDLARGLILISPSSEVESSDNAESFTDMVEAWAMTNQELVNQFPDSDTLLRVSPSVKVPLLVSGGFHARLLNEQPWPAKLFSVLTNHWRRRWLSAQDAHMDLEIWVHLPCSKRRELGTQWAGITSHVLVVRGGEGQPNGNGMEEHLRAKLVNAASFTCHVIDEAPLLVSVTHAASVNNEMAKFCARVCGLDTPELEPADNGSANDSLSPSITQATASPPSRSGSPSSLHESVHLDGGVHRSRAESVCSGVSSNSRSSGLTPTTTQALRNIMDFNMWKDLNRSQNSWTTGDTSCSSGDIRGRTTSCVTASALAVSPDVRSRATSDASSFVAQPDGVPRSRGMTDLHENEVLVMAAGQPEPGYKGMSASTDLAPQALCPVEPPYDSPTSQAEGSDARSEGDDATDAEDDVSIERGALLRRSFGRLSTKPCVLLFPSEYDGENFKTGETNAECAAQDYAMDANAAARMSIVIDEEVVAYTSY